MFAVVAAVFSFGRYRIRSRVLDFMCAAVVRRLDPVPPLQAHALPREQVPAEFCPACFSNTFSPCTRSS